MTRDDFRELIKARIKDIEGPDLTAGVVINAAADACVEAMGRVRAEAWEEGAAKCARRSEEAAWNATNDALPAHARRSWHSAALELNAAAAAIRALREGKE